MAKTPLMAQYKEVKEKYRDCLLFYRLGDFYELFYDDALTASHELELTLTGKSAGADGRVPMCGVPFHAAELYIYRLIQKMVDTLGALPFKSAPASSNVFLADGNALLAEGKSNVSWAFNHTPNVDSWRATVVTALAKYSADPTDANWAEVVSAFVDGWAAEYNIVNG